MKTFGIRTYIRNLITKPNKKAIWVFGFQKSGTSAVAALLAYISNLSATIDTKYLWDPYATLMERGEVNFEDHVNKYSYPFSKDIIKEPEAIQFIDKIDSFFELEKYVFIIRNPFSNIRSILNRLNLYGNQRTVEFTEIHPNWRFMFPGMGKNYIHDLAKKWVQVNSCDLYMYRKACSLVKYEDFKSDKENFIESLAHQLRLPVKKTISEVKDQQFQPKGNSEVNLKEFFGSRNVKIISQVCGRKMYEFGYEANRILYK